MFCFVKSAVRIVRLEVLSFFDKQVKAAIRVQNY